jgi:hypothetical protein
MTLHHSVCDEVWISGSRSLYSDIGRISHHSVCALIRAYVYAYVYACVDTPASRSIPATYIHLALANLIKTHTT